MIGVILYRLVSAPALQLNTRSSADLILIHASCPAGFETVEGIISEQYACRCSRTDLNIQICNENTEDVMLKVRGLCVYMMWGVGCPSSVLYIRM